jgi:hypothetical protein
MSGFGRVLFYPSLLKAALNPTYELHALRGRQPLRRARRPDGRYCSGRPAGEALAGRSEQPSLCGLQ